MKLINKIKQIWNSLLNKKNNAEIVGILTILVLLWSILYLIPQIFVSLFHTILGNLILFIIVLLVSGYNYIYGIILGISFIVIYRFNQLSKFQEGFQWTKKSTQDFLAIQNTINPNKVFDVNTIQNVQASQEEVDYFNKNGIWPWSQDVIQLYQEAVSKNPYIRTSPQDAVAQTRKIYNQAAILEILSYQTKEGQFLLNGVLVRDISGNPLEELPSGYGDFGYNSGLIGDLRDDIIKCNSKEFPSLQRITYTGKGGIFNQQTKKITPVDFNDAEKVIPGFTFVNGPCNPCGPLNQTPDYSCPFKLNVKNKPPFISNIWQYLWEVKDTPLVSQPSFLNQYINPNEFPLLSELQTELNKQTNDYE
jgi:hypothetical protein